MAEALLTGRMRLVSREDDGAGGSVLGFAAASVRLGRRELSVLAAAESGVANKLVAIEQSLAYSTVSESLQTALVKLGFAGRTEFLKVMGCLRWIACKADDGQYSTDNGVRLLERRTDCWVNEVHQELCWLFLPVEAFELAPCLTLAERQVVTGVLNGRTNAAIATARHTSCRTVANQLAAIYRKLGVSSRWELAARAAGAPAAKRAARASMQLA